MYKDENISVVIPTYKVEKHIQTVVSELPDFIDNIIIVDDKCPNKSFEKVEDYEKVTIINHKENKGVGGAVISGYKKALEINSDIIIKIDGDGQMDSKYIEVLILPIINNKADYAKGNRFNDFKALKKMPKIRLFGNSILSFMVKMASGYWDIMDPTNGFTAITSKAVSSLNTDKISNRYFFETDMLINLNINNLVVKDIPIPAKYEEEDSNLSIRNVILTFPFKMMKGLRKRILYKYYIYNFNMASIYLAIGLPLFIFGVVFGLYRWILAIVHNIANPTGTIMLAVLPVILGVQFLLQAISVDINNVPKK